MLKKIRKPVKKKRDPFLAFDPGMGGTGYALFGRESNIPLLTGIIKAEQGLSADDRMMNLFLCLDKLVRSVNAIPLGYVAIEQPRYFESATGHASAASGNLTVLFMAVSCAVAAAYANRVKVKMVPVNDWKGTLPKAVVINRISKRLNVKQSAYKSHEWDAIGIGLHTIGEF